MKKQLLDDILLFENEDVLVINKSSGISTLDDRKDATNVLLEVKELYPQIKNCHRLDKYTSGALLFAKNPETYRSISMQFQNRQVQKVYHAVVFGQTDFSNFEVNLPLIIKGSGNVNWDLRKGKASITTFNTLKNYKNFSLVECQPYTGRKHQIRVHLKYVQHPIIADLAYGGDFVFLSQIKRNYQKSNHSEKPLIDRVALHAFSLGFELPKGKSVAIEAPYPKDFRILLKQLDKYG